MIASVFPGVGRFQPAVRWIGGFRSPSDGSAPACRNERLSPARRLAVGLADRLHDLCLVVCLIGLLWLLVWPDVAHAQRTPAKSTSVYSCRDDNGRVINSDRPSLECANQPLREMNANGITTRNIPAPLTREQLERKGEAEERARVQGLRDRQDRSRDRALLLAYQNAQALEMARRRQLAELNHEIQLAQTRMVTSHRELGAANAALAAMTNEGQIAEAKRNIRILAQSILADDAAIQRVRGEIAEVEQRFDADGARLKELLREPDGGRALGSGAQLR